jgi:phosphatidylserine decarboxylase
MTYSVDALLGTSTPESSPDLNHPSYIFSRDSPSPDESISNPVHSEDVIKADADFANVNGITYTLPTLLSGPKNHPHHPSMDASTVSAPGSEAEVRADLALGDTSTPWYQQFSTHRGSALYYIVIYLAPGDYHRFHSPAAWVCEKRRHFAGELYSVSPYLQRTLPGLFTLNERVVLLGRWRWGFFSMTPVGATNVGSIIINFDKELRTNSLLTDTAADREAEEAANRGEPYVGYSEASYGHASVVLRGQALKRGEEMGGFQLGSTVVLVFEGPKGKKPVEEQIGGEEKEVRHGGWNWNVEKGQTVKVGESLGWVDVANG